MKKIYLLTFAGLLAGAVSAQSTVHSIASPAKPMPAKTFQFDKAKFHAKYGNQANSTGQSYWVNYGMIMDQLLGGGAGNTGPGVVNGNYLCTDSLMVGNFGTSGYSAVWVNNLGDVLDISASNINQILGTNYDHSTAYSVDSASIIYSYTRNVNYVDTLMFNFYAGSGSPDFPTYYFSGMASDYGQDTVAFKGMKYSYTANRPNPSAASNMITVKVPLTITDTAVGLAEKMFALPSPYSVGAGKFFACGVTFKPGYPYALGDSIDNRNAFFFASYEENGASTFPSYTSCVPAASPACDYNCSQIVTTDVRYNNAGSWNGLYIPSYAYTAPFGFEHHLISYHVTQTNVGMQQLKNNVFSVEQNIPNPFSGTSTIGYTLKNAAKSVKLEVMDFSGRLVMTQAENNLKPGHYNFTVEASKLSKGVYFYSVNVDGNRITNKMIVE